MSSVCVCVCVCVLFSINIVISGVYSLAPACDKKKKKSLNTRRYFLSVWVSLFRAHKHIQAVGNDHKKVEKKSCFLSVRPHYPEATSSGPLPISNVSVQTCSQHAPSPNNKKGHKQLLISSAAFNSSSVSYE